MASTTVNFNLKTAGYVNYANQTLTFRLLTAGAEASTGDQSYVTLPGVVTATSAANGDGSVSLFRNGKSGIESVYEVILPNREKAKFIIPSGSATIELATLLVDHVPGGSDTQQSSVYAEAIKRANHTGTQALSTISDAGTIASQASNNVSISGGSISGVTLTASTANLTDATDKRLMTDAQETRLDSVESNATADQTNAEIRAAVEAATDSNVFTDDDHTKLNGIETSATADQTASEIRALVESATDSNVFTDADHTKLENIAGTTVEEVQDIAGGLVASGGTKTGIAVTYDDTNGNMDFVVASQTDQNFTTADHDKLDGIAPGAAVNRTEEEIQDIAGALVATGGTKTGIAVTYDDANNNMDFVVASQTDQNFTNADHTKLDAINSEVTTLSLPASTTISTFAKTFLDDADAVAVKSTLGIADTGAIAGFVPKSITFPSTSDFLSLATSADLNVGTSDFTLSFWARLDGSGTEPILNKYSGAGYSLKFSSGSLILLIQGTGDPLSVTLATGLNDNKWHVYVVSVDRDGNAVAYVDNNIQTPAPVSDIQSSLDNTTAFRIGYDGANASSDIAFGNYVVLHKDALSASEAAQIYFSADTALTVGSPLPSLMVDLREATETFTDVSSSPLPVITNGTVRFNQDRLTEFTGTNVLATSTLGYTTGSGGTFNQSTSSTGTGKAKTVVLNKATGQITLDGAALAANTPVAFALTNSTIAANDILVFNHVSGGTIGGYNFNAVASSGTATVTVRNITSSSLTETPVISFAVIKAVTS